MHKFYLSLFGMFVFTSALYAAENLENKENASKGNSLLDIFKTPRNKEPITVQALSQRRASVDAATPPKIENSGSVADEVKGLSKKLEFVNGLVRSYKNETKELERRVYERFDENEEVMNKQFSSIDKKFNDFTTSAVQALERTESKLNSRIVEPLSHDLQPSVDNLTEELAKLSDQITEYETQLQNFANKENLEGIEAAQQNLQESIKAIEEAMKQSPTVEFVTAQIADELKALAKGSTQKLQERYPTKEYVDVQFVKKADQSALNEIKENVAKLLNVIPSQKNTKGFARQAHVNGSIHRLNEQLDKKLEGKADRLDLENYATKDDIKSLVSQQTHETAVQQLADKADRSDLENYALKDEIKDLASKQTAQELQDKIAVLEKNSPKEQLKAGLIYFAVESSKGVAAHQGSHFVTEPVCNYVSEMKQLRTLVKLLNQLPYVDKNPFTLRDGAVPITQFAIGLIHQACVEMQTQSILDTKNDTEFKYDKVFKEAAKDAGASAVVMLGNKGLCAAFDCADVQEIVPEAGKALTYGFSYALVRSLLALFS